MDQELENDRVMRENEIQRMLSQRDSERIRQGVEAYKRDLPQLLRERKARHVVAYDGETQVGLAPTREKLLQELIDKGTPKTGNMFIKVIKSLDESDNIEHFHSAHSR